jgi:tungstate transport system substrate-binding protein
MAVSPDAIISAMLPRRHLLIAALPAFMPMAAMAQQRKSLGDPLRVGVDQALFDSGLASALQRAFGRDTGIVVQLVRSSALPLLEALERGEFDAALANAPGAEAALDKQGLVHDRQRVAGGDFAIVGPAPRAKGKDPAAIRGGRDAVQALIELNNAALALPGAVTFLSAGDGSGAHVIEQALWRAAKIAPAAPWYAAVDARSSLIAQARARGAYAIVERGAWLEQGGAPLAVLVEGDPLLREEIHVMRSFRVNHPAAKIFVAWISGPKGRRVVSGSRGYRAD